MVDIAKVLYEFVFPFALSEHIHFTFNITRTETTTASSCEHIPSSCSSGAVLLYSLLFNFYSTVRIIFIYIRCVEASNVINVPKCNIGPKCNKKIGPKCNKGTKCNTD